MSDKRILFVTLSNIGDLVMTTPVLQALHAKYPDHLIDIVADRRSGELLDACPYLGDIIWKDKKANRKQQWRFFRRLRKYHYELTVDLRGPWVALMSRTKARATKNNRQEGMHAVEHHLTALKGICESTGDPTTIIWIAPSAQKIAQVLIPYHAEDKILALAPGANWPGKIWPAKSYRDLIETCVAEYDRFVLFGGAADETRCNEISQQFDDKIINLCGRTNLMETAACLSLADAFVGNDSGIGHMAAAIGVPTVTVFGEGDPVRYRPWGSQATVVEAPNKDLTRLSATVVANALKTHLGNLGS